MKKNPRLIGDKHVKSIFSALKAYIEKSSLDGFPDTTIKTAYFILDLYPNIENVYSKFDSSNINTAKDLTLFLSNGEKIDINLYSIKKGAKIQQKNPGAKSFFTKYFLSPHLQQLFNSEFEKLYLHFLQQTASEIIGEHYLTDKKELRKIIAEHFPSFTENLSSYKHSFLYGIREVCFALLKDSYNERQPNFINAYDYFFMTSDITIITTHGKATKDITVEKFSPGLPDFSDIELFKKGNYSVGIRYGEVALTLRFKFESNPLSSIKLAASYITFESNTYSNQLINTNTIKFIEDLLQTNHSTEKDDSNAIGKCHEALTYYCILKDNPSIKQVNPNECIEQLEKYSCKVKKDTLGRLYNSTPTIVPSLLNKIKEKYGDYKLDSIELVPDNYIKDKLDTSDLQLLLKVNGNYIIEKVSLKAIKTSSSTMTLKNPGIGSILGPIYFNSGNLIPIVEIIKEQFSEGKASHRESLEFINAQLGNYLKSSTQEQLITGISNLLGNSLIGITVYEENRSFCKEPKEIKGPIKVKIASPSTIQNTLSWNGGAENIRLRVKFSRSQKYGWSSIKLSAESNLREE